MCSFAGRLVRTTIVSLVLVAATEARAQSEQDIPLLTTTTTLALVPLTTTGGAIAALVMLTGGSDDPGKMDDGDDGFKGMEVYLRQNSLQLAQDLSVGRGPTLDELSQGLQLSGRSSRALAELVRSDRAALLDLAAVDTLNTARAAAFARRLHALIASHPELKAEVERFAAKHRG